MTTDTPETRLERIPTSLRCLDWQQPTEGMMFIDGETMLAAVGVRGPDPDKWGYEFSVITIHVDEHYFAVELEGEPWGWEWDDVELFIRIKR